MTEQHQRAKALFLEAVALPPGKRPAFLHGACTDPALRHEIETLLAFHDNEAPPPARLLVPARPATSARSTPSPALAFRAVTRLRVVCIVIAVVVGGTWGVLNSLEGELLEEFGAADQWLPPVLLIGASLAMLGLTYRPLPHAVLIRVGLAYEVVVSLALVGSQYAGAFERMPAAAINADRIGLSAVATWTLFFSVLVPARPREALVALVLSNAAVPLFYWQQQNSGQAPALPTEVFVSVFVLPYAIGVATAYVASRIVHQLGVEVRQAQDLGAYRLDSLIGRGGMGEVWRASHHTLARPAAIKVIRRDALGSDPHLAAAAIARFEAEAQIIASLQSPNTVELYDFGTTEDGTIFYVMELLDGVDLDRLVRTEGPLPAARVVPLLTQMCHSLAEAHSRGLLHRDIKPANLYLCRRGLDTDVVKVLDFGLASTFAEAQARVAAGALRLAGTPDYLAPEVVHGGTIDGRADLYAVGCVAFWLLTGRVVFPATSTIATLAAHCDMPPPSARDFAPLPIPDDLDRIILRCLQKNPDHRPAGAIELAAELAAVTVPAV